MSPPNTAAHDSPKPAVIDALFSFTPPVDIRRLVERLLAEVPPQYLVGLEKVVLRDDGGLEKRERRRRKALMRRERRTILGTYCRAEPDRRARIDLFVDRICEGWPSWLLRIPPFRDVRIGSVLFHELGHHIEMSLLPRHGDPERDAERWSKDLLRPYLRRRYGYLAPLFRVARKILRWVRPDR